MLWNAAPKNVEINSSLLYLTRMFARWSRFLVSFGISKYQTENKCFNYRLKQQKSTHQGKVLLQTLFIC